MTPAEEVQVQKDLILSLVLDKMSLEQQVKDKEENIKIQMAYLSTMPKGGN